MSLHKGQIFCGDAKRISSVLLIFAVLFSVYNSVYSQNITPDPRFIQLEFYSPRSFIEADSTPILWIGDKKIDGSQHKDRDVRYLIFYLTPEEFASVTNGDEVSIHHMDTYYFGLLDKTKLSMKENLSYSRQVALKYVNQMIAKYTIEPEHSHLINAANYLRETIVSSNWRDELHLRTDKVNTVFNDDIALMSELSALMGTPNHAVTDLELDVLTYMIVAVNRSYVAQTILDAYTNNISFDLWMQAGKYFQQADKAAAERNYVVAINFYHNAVQSVSPAMPTLIVTGGPFGTSISTCEVQSTPVYFSPASNWLVTSGHYFELQLWSVKDKTVLHKFATEGQSDIADYGFSPDGKYLAIASRNGATRLYAPYTGQQLRTFHEPQDSVNYPSLSIKFTPDGKSLVTADQFGIYLWNPLNGTLQQSFKAQNEDVIQVSPDSRYLLVHEVMNEEHIRILDLNQNKEVQVFPQYSYGLTSPDNKYLVTGGPNGLKVWNANNFLLTYDLTIPSDPTNYYTSSDFSTDSQLILGNTVAPVTRVWSLKTGKLVNTFGDENTPSSDGKFVPKTHWLITLMGGYSPNGNVERHRLQLWDAVSGKVLKEFSVGTKHIEAFAISPNGFYIAANTQEGPIFIWDIVTAKQIGVICNANWH